MTIPNQTEWNKIAIVKATQNWSDGYEFDPIDFSEKKQDYKSEDSDGKEPNPVDYGHIFPVEYLREFHTHNLLVHGDIRKTFKCRRRFWNIKSYAEHVEKILDANPKDIGSPVDGEDDKLAKSINAEFQNVFSQELLEEMLGKVQGPYDAAEWEKGLKAGLEKLAQATDSFRVETTANKTEKEHGADLLIYLPNPIDEDIEYVIAVQVKDHEGDVSEDSIDQVLKAKDYFGENSERREGIDVRLIEMMVVITKAERIDNEKVKKYAQDRNVEILFRRDFERLLTRLINQYLVLERPKD